MVELFFWILVGFVLIQRLIELRIAKRNTTKSLAQGGREYGAGHYPWIVILHLLWYAAWILEVVIRGPQLNAFWPLWLVIFLAALAVRYWVITTLGPAWSMRIVVIPGAKRIQSGPYRYLNHPNYLVVAVELFVIPMIFNAWLTASFFTLLYLMTLFIWRIPAERKALKALSP